MHFTINRAIALGLLLMLAACGGGEQPATSDTPAGASDEQPAAEPTKQARREAAPAVAATGQGSTFEVSLSGSGDADGTGTATVSLDPDSDEVCYEIAVRNIDPPTAAHIHTGAADETGGVAVPFDAPGAEGDWQDCVSVDPATVQQIIENPAGYYVNVHNEPHPSGAIRGQLGDVPGA